MESQKQVVDKLKDANNILVTVQSDPSIDALSSCIGLTLFLNELGKHATAVFSGQVPHVLEFLQPEKTIEPTTNSLRDFIISLDKSKADKLRYKVEDKVVKIFITPYKTSITDRDLEFSQGDFNVDIVVAIGVHSQDELDQAVTAHGHILHDATVISINTTEGDSLGSIDWTDTDASSLSEMTASLIDPLGKDKLDNQIATAFLTGIVEQTERFSNNKTTPKTMSVSAKLLTAGANQELVASKLAETEPVGTIEEPFERESDKVEETVAGPPVPHREKVAPGTLEIDHSHDNPFADDAAGGEVPELPLPKVPKAPSSESRRKHIEPLLLEDKSSEKTQPGQSVPSDDLQAKHPVPVLTPWEEIKPRVDSIEPEVPDEAVAALKELQRAQADKAKAMDAGDERQAEIEAAAEKAAEDFLRNKQINIDDQGHLRLMTPEHRQFLGDAAGEDADPSATADEKPSGNPDSSKFVLNPPTMGGTLTANSRPEDSMTDPTTDPFSTPKSEAPMLTHDTKKNSLSSHASKSIEPSAHPKDELSLPTPLPDAGSARDAINDVMASAPPESTVNSNPLARVEEKMVSSPSLHHPEPLTQVDDSPGAPKPATHDDVSPAPNSSKPASEPLASVLSSEDNAKSEAVTADAGKALDMPVPPSLNLPAPNLAPKVASGTSGSPPPVPPPMMPPFGT